MKFINVSHVSKGDNIITSPYFIPFSSIVFDGNIWFPFTKKKLKDSLY